MPSAFMGVRARLPHYAADSATGTASLKLDSDPLGSPIALNDSADALLRLLGRRTRIGRRGVGKDPDGARR